MSGISGIFGAVRYINLDKRTDRKEQIEGELRQIGIDRFERFPAVEHTNGAIGCAYSHLNVLKEAKERGYPSILILEDDFEFIVPKEEFWKAIEAVKGVDYDVIMLGYALNKHEDHSDTLLRVIDAQTASAYLVNSGFYDALIKNYEEAIPKLERTGEHWNYANDRSWKSLQPHSKWYAFKNRMGKQRASQSDNRKGEIVNYMTGGKKVRKHRRKSYRRKKHKSRNLSKRK